MCHGGLQSAWRTLKAVWLTGDSNMWVNVFLVSCVTLLASRARTVFWCLFLFPQSNLLEVQQEINTLKTTLALCKKRMSLIGCDIGFLLLTMFFQRLNLFFRSSSRCLCMENPLWWGTVRSLIQLGSTVKLTKKDHEEEQFINST